MNSSLVERFTEAPGHEKNAGKGTNDDYARFPLMGKNNVMSATDALESMGQRLVVGTNFYLAVNTESEEETTRLFEQLSEGGKIEIPLNKTFWGSYGGMCQDKFGIQWMIDYKAAGCLNKDQLPY